MSYPDKLLGEGEEVVMDLHQHWKLLVAPFLEAVVIVGAASFVIAHFDNKAVHLIALVVGVVLLSVLSIAPYLKWTTTQYVVTTKRVVIREGVFSRQGRDIPMTRVNDVSFHHTFIERLFRSGTLTVESAGERGQVTLHDVPHVEEVQRTIYRLSEAADPGAEDHEVHGA